MKALENLNDPSWLAERYAHHSLASIAAELGVHRNTVRNRMILFGIERKGRGEYFAGVPKPASQKQKMSEARRRFWEAHPERDDFRLNQSRVKTKHGISKGYRRVYTLEIGRRREHILIVEKAIGRKLRPGEQVHHVNGNKLDNRPENLQLLTNSEHQKIHNATRPRDEFGRFIG